VNLEFFVERVRGLDEPGQMVPVLVGREQKVDLSAPVTAAMFSTTAVIFGVGSGVPNTTPQSIIT
jgi:hypothetical protein